jgi:hypothetical protein
MCATALPRIAALFSIIGIPVASASPALRKEAANTDLAHGTWDADLRSILVLRTVGHSYPYWNYRCTISLPVEAR